MKLLKPTAALLLLMPISMINAAEEPKKAAEPAQEMTSHQGMDMMNGMTEEQKDQHLRARQEQMLMIHDLSNKILAEPDAEKKEELKKQHRELMKAHHAQMMGHQQHKKERKQHKQEHKK
ncbi:MAG: hypothetical protein ACNA7G_01290 [Methylobacter sp.]